MDFDIAAEIEEKEKLVVEYNNAINELKKRLEEAKSLQTPSPNNIDTVSSEKSESTFAALAGPSESAVNKSRKSVSVIKKARSELPSVGLQTEFEWNNINVHVGSGTNHKQILRDMNGSISSGQLMAIMGGSGSYFVYEHSIGHIHML